MDKEVNAVKEQDSSQAAQADSTCYYTRNVKSINRKDNILDALCI